jgi:CubicO group peptidase (beta-lactamase class C family)
VDEGDLVALLREHALRHSVPGAALGILRDGAVSIACHGVADVRAGRPVTPESLFGVGSLTKSMVATVIVRLAEADRLSLEDPVAAHVPELHGNRWAATATLRDLLANRSGLPLRAELEFDFAGGGEGDGALSRLVVDAASGVPTSGYWSYTNVGWCVLGRVIETVTDTAWAGAMRRHLASAGLRETSFGSEARTGFRVSGHQITAEGPAPVEPTVAPAYGPAGTTAVSSAADLLRFAAMHLQDSALAGMREVHAECPIYGWLDAWCLGWARFDWPGGPVWGWDSVLDGERSVLRIVPAHQAAVVLMTNGSTGRHMYRSLFADLMESLFGIGVAPLRLDPSPEAAPDLSRFAGAYARPDLRVEVTASGSCLQITSEQDSTEAVALDERTFLVDAADPDNPTVTFGEYDESGRPHVLYDMLWGLPRLAE